MLLLKFLLSKVRGFTKTCILKLKRAELFRYFMPWSVWFFCVGLSNAASSVMSPRHHWTYFGLIVLCYLYLNITSERWRVAAYVGVLFGGTIMAGAAFVIDARTPGNPISPHTLWLPYVILFFMPFGFTLRDIVNKMVIEYREFAERQARIPAPLRPTTF